MIRTVLINIAPARIATPKNEHHMYSTTPQLLEFVPDRHQTQAHADQHAEKLDTHNLELKVKPPGHKQR